MKGPAFGALVLALALAAGAAAQYREYYLRGKVVDPQQVPIAGVEVQLRDKATSRAYSFKTDEEGVFKFAGLPRGVYEVTFTREGSRLGSGFEQGAVIARHGSWNRKPPSGYDVVFVRFDARGNPLDKPVPVLKSFLAGDGKTRGRPTWVTWDKTGALLVSDDTANIIWRVVAPDATPAPAPVRAKSEGLPPQTELRGDPRRAFEQD